MWISNALKWIAIEIKVDFLSIDGEIFSRNVARG